MRYRKQSKKLFCLKKKDLMSFCRKSTGCNMRTGVPIAANIKSIPKFVHVIYSGRVKIIFCNAGRTPVS